MGAAVGLFFPIGLAMSFFASLTGWTPNLIALAVASALMFLLGVVAHGNDQKSGTGKYGCLLYLLLNVGIILYGALDTGVWTWKVVVDAAVLAVVLFLSALAPTRKNRAHE